MKTFIYKYSEKTRNHGGSYYTYVGKLTETFVDQWQLVMMALEHFKQLPAAAFERHPMGGWAENRDGLKAAGFAQVFQL